MRLRGVGSNGNFKGKWQSPDRPAPTITTAPSPRDGGGAGCILYDLTEETGTTPMPPTINKPPYGVPSMREIAGITWNGLQVVSIFSGGGGSCLGYRMAGYKIRWANEFAPAAQETYRANAAGDCLLDTRDIHHICPEDILRGTGLTPGELDVFDGSPPCQAFSTAGQRHKGWGKETVYAHGARQKNETLFTEYLRILHGLKPKAFVAENVSGLVKGMAKGYFKEIFQEMKGCGYRVQAKLLDAQWLGVPQHRERIIFIGVREDLGRDPIFPTPLPYRYSVREALPSLNEVIHDTGGVVRGKQIINQPYPRITNGGNVLKSSHYLAPEADMEGRADRLGRRAFTIAELKRICSFPDDFILKGSYAQQWACLGNSVPPVMMAHIARTIARHIFATESPEALDLGPAND